MCGRWEGGWKGGERRGEGREKRGNGNVTIVADHILGRG